MDAQQMSVCLGHQTSVCYSLFSE